MKLPFSVVTLLAFSSAAAASTLQVHVNSPYHFGSGGEFQVVPQAGMGYSGETGRPSDLDASSFQTFCVETNENLFQSDGFYHAEVNDGAVNGGSGGQTRPGYDPLDDRTAWLYEQFRDGVLPGYFDYAGGRQQAAGALQAAIWFIEDETDYDGLFSRPTSDPLRALADSFLQLSSDAVLNGYENHRVQILNLDQDGQVRQDVLTLVPLPSAALSAAAGLTGFALIRRRRGDAM